MTGETRVFPLAKMSRLFRVLSAILLALPVAFVIAWLSTSPPVRWPLLAIAGVLVLTWLAVWLYFRPSSFETSPDGLTIVWPTRRRRIPRGEIARARILAWGEFQKEFGWPVRIGAGGLWGAFGLLWTKRGGFMELYISRLDRWVLIERTRARPIVVTPERLQEFVSALSSNQ